MSLTNGAALQVEDLSVTMKVVTFQCPQYATMKQVERLRKTLLKRKISHVFNFKVTPAGELAWWNFKIVVGKRTLMYLVLGE